VTLNLSHNRISKVEGLQNCKLLKTLDLSHNHISDIKSLEQVTELSSLSNLDLKENLIEEHTNVVSFFSRLDTLTCLYLSGNPCVRMISHYRRQFAISMPNLYYLDDKPFFENERLLA
jgi:dynein assembly factor 1